MANYEKEPARGEERMRKIAKQEASDYDGRKIGAVSMVLSPLVAYTLGIPLGLVALGGGVAMHSGTRKWIGRKLGLLKDKTQQRK